MLRTNFLKPGSPTKPTTKPNLPPKPSKARTKDSFRPLKPSESFGPRGFPTQIHAVPITIPARIGPDALPASGRVARMRRAAARYCPASLEHARYRDDHFLGISPSQITI